MTENTVTARDIQNSMKDKDGQTSVLEWNGLQLNIKKTLSLNEMIEFVNGVVKSCFTEETNEYVPEIKDFAERCCVVELYAGIELPDDVNEKYSIVYGSDIVARILPHVAPEQFDGMIEAIEKKVAYIAQSNIEHLNKQVSDVVSGLSSLEENLARLFGGIDNDTISKIAGAIADGKFDTAKLITAFSNSSASNG